MVGCLMKNIFASSFVFTDFWMIAIFCLRTFNIRSCCSKVKPSVCGVGFIECQWGCRLSIKRHLVLVFGDAYGFGLPTNYHVISKSTLIRNLYNIWRLFWVGRHPENSQSRDVRKGHGALIWQYLKLPKSLFPLTLGWWWNLLWICSEVLLTGFQLALFGALFRPPTEELLLHLTQMLFRVSINSTKPIVFRPARIKPSMILSIRHYWLIP